MSLAEPLRPSFSRPRPVRPGLAIYSVRRAFAADDEACLARIRGAGFDRVCMRGSDRSTARDLREKLDDHGLVSPVVVLEPGIDPAEQVQAARLLGASFITIPSAPVFFRIDGAGRHVWKTSVASEEFRHFVEGLRRLSPMVSGEGLRLLYHFHDLDFVPMDDGLSPYDWLSTRVPPAELGFHLDTAWLRDARVDLPGLLQRLAGRIAAVDLKDVRPLLPPGPRGENMCPAGEGVIDFLSMIPVLDAAGAEEFLIENEPLPDEGAGVLSARDHLDGLGVFAA